MINLRIQSSEPKQQALAPRITVVGVGGAGGNAIGNMIASGLDGVEFLVCNTDAQALAGSQAPKKIQLGTTITGGLGAGAKPEVGRAAAEESLDELMDYIDGSNMVFITSGMGGGTGTGVSPVLARACKEAGILTVGVVTKPFHFEGTMRMKAAEEGIREMQQYVDTLIVIPNQNLFRIATDKTTFADAFKMADGVLQSAVRGVTDLMVMPGLVNLDFNDIKTTMTEMGKAMMGTGEATGERRATMASEAAINNPLLDDVTMKGAKGVIINIAGGNDMTLFEIDEACNRIREEVDVDANIIFGTSIDEHLQGSLRVTVLATGIESEAERKAREEDKRGKRGGGGDTRGFTMAQPRQVATPAHTTETRQAAAQAATHTRSYAATTAMVVPESAPTEAYVQGQAFIPPAPQEPDMAVASTVPYTQIMAGLAKPKYDEPESIMPEPVQPQYDEQPVSMAPSAPVSAVDLAIPAGIVPVSHHPRAAVPAPASEPALSLFQRITNRVRGAVESAFDDQSASGYDAYDAPAHRGAASRGPRASVQSAAVTSQPLPAASREPVSVAQAAKPAVGQAELDLEIPAFLRRQAS